jgi:hypothetical protein
MAGLLGLTLIGCSTASPTPPVATPSSVAPNAAGVSSEELATWRAFRTRWGLTADDAWMLQVESMPGSANNDFDVPLIDLEIDHIGQQVVHTDRLIEFANGYGASHPEAFAGVIVDGPTVILLMKAPVGSFVEEVADLVPEGAPVEVRAVPYSHPELLDKAARVLGDADWFTQHKLELIDAHVGAGAVQLRYQGGDGKEADAIFDRYGRPDWLEVRWEGPGPWTGATGTLIITAKDRTGRTVADADCVVDPVDPLVTYETGVALHTNAQGVCRLRFVPAVDVRVKVWWPGQPYREDPAAKKRVTVPPNGKVPVTVVLAPWP